MSDASTGGTRSGSQPSARPSLAAQLAPSTPEVMTYIIVGSQEHALALERQISEGSGLHMESNQPWPGLNIRILIADSPEASSGIDAMLSVTSQGFLQAGVGLVVVDLRGPGTVSR